VSGTVADRRVRCLDAAAQVLCHTGYEPQDLERHAHDISLLESLRA
jgi:hypothetical protein